MTTYDFSHKRGDTYNGAEFTITVNSSPLDLTGASFLCQFKSTPLSAPVLTFTLGAGISLVTPAAGVFKFDSQIINLPAGSYVYDVQITLANGTVKTYISGTMTIIEDVSRV